jgi:hypothetical protein
MTDGAAACQLDQASYAIHNGRDGFMTAAGQTARSQITTRRRDGRDHGHGRQGNRHWSASPTRPKATASCFGCFLEGTNKSGQRSDDAFGKSVITGNTIGPLATRHLADSGDGHEERQSRGH